VVTKKKFLFLTLELVGMEEKTITTVMGKDDGKEVSELIKKGFVGAISGEHNYTNNTISTTYVKPIYKLQLFNRFDRLLIERHGLVWVMRCKLNILVWSKYHDIKLWFYNNIYFDLFIKPRIYINPKGGKCE
jgi:dsDNA-specific endonuclease/ATPase MutS2